MANKKQIIGIIIVFFVTISLFIFIGGPIIFDEEPSNGDQDYGYQIFYDYPELASGTINFSICPLAMDAIKKIDPLGNLNPEMGHSFPTTHSGLWFNDIESVIPPYAVKAPAGGFIVEISIDNYNTSTGYGDISILMAHTTDVHSSVGHVSKLSQAIINQLDNLENGFKFVKIPIQEGDIIGYAGGESSPAVGMDWKIFDHTIDPHFIKPSRYNRKAYTVGITNRTEGELRANITAKLHREQPPKIGILDFDKEGYIVGNWFYENITEYEDPMSEWDKFLGIVYDQYNSTQIRICAGGILNLNSSNVYKVVGNSPDPATINSLSGCIAYNLTSGGDIVGEDKRTLLVNHTGNQRIRIQAWGGHIADPTFDSDSKYYIR
ncbi:MAG: hypothetical protein EU541_05105 [Promethearchaeota archaeon]|nr:MAG: hypothetical protein EU541_05105 [Candidatus Lokiarchaeota archaeon]